MPVAGGMRPEAEVRSRRRSTPWRSSSFAAAETRSARGYYHGFSLPLDAPEVLDFYADRSPIFMAAGFDADAAVSAARPSAMGRPCT